MSDNAELELAQFFTPSRPNSQSNGGYARYSDSEVQAISHLLRDIKYEYWNCPRIYIVLRTLGKLEFMKDFADQGITDLWFPFPPESLPGGLNRALFAEFRKTQKTVLTGVSSLENGRHCHLSTDDIDEDMFPRPLEWEEDLGSGGFSYVFKVRGRKSMKEYALKQIRRRRHLSESLEVMEYFESELQVLKKLRGRHFVELIGSYTSLDHIGLIMSPVADANLASFLSKPSPDEKRLLWNFFGCLSNALAYLHFTLKIRHKDIKPENILVKENNVLLTDFGMALDWADIGQATTRQDQRKSSIYCAPEVAKNEPRRSSSDIWSLGCVYLEMITVLRDMTVGELRRFFSNNGSGEKAFWRNPESISLWLAILGENEGSKFENGPLGWIKRMLQQEDHRRPTARELSGLIFNSGRDDSGLAFYGECCQPCLTPGL